MQKSIITVIKAVSFTVVCLSACESKYRVRGRELPLTATQIFCRQLIKELPKDYIHGYVTVPEDYAVPQARLIQVFYYGRISAKQTPVVFFNGGPGGSSYNSYQLIQQMQPRRTDWAKVPFIFIDQRGTGCSDEYPEFKEASDAQRLALYSSKQIVRDAEGIRKKLLGTRKWKVFGQSHGAQIVHRYMVDAPEGIFSAHAHGNSIGVPVNEYLKMRIVSQNRVLKEYLKRFPEDENDFQILARHFVPTTCYNDTKFKRQFCGKTITHNLLSFLGFADKWNTLHEWVNDMSGDGNINRSAIQDFVDTVVMDANTSSTNTAYAGLFISKFDYGEQGLDYWSCTKMMEEIKATGETPDLWPLHECSTSLSTAPTDEETKSQENLNGHFAAIPEGLITLEAFKAALEKNPEIPFYLYSGELDVFVPRAAFENEVKFLGPLIKYTHFTGSGHDGFYTEPLVWRNLLKDKF